MKKKRQNAILEILRKKDIYTQDDLTAALGAAGFSVAQATISRDIREMGLVKENTPNGQRYAVPDSEKSKNPYERIFRDGLISADYSENILVLKTLSGMAMAVAEAFDKMEFPDILGSVAGDNVIICVVKNKAAAAALAEKLK